MVRRKRNIPQRGGRQQANAAGGDEPDIYQEMLTEAGVAAPAASSSERPLKRRREGAPSHTSIQPAGPTEPTPAPITAASRSKSTQGKSLDEEDEDDDDDAEFEDVAIPEPTIQTVELASDEDEDDEDEDLRFEDVDVMMPLLEGDSESQEPKELELNLSAQKATMTSKQAADRRKPITKEERERRFDIHKAHLICLLSHVARRNHWCNDPQVQSQLRSHLTDKMIQYLTPGTNLSQFGRTESLKNGLRQVAEMWTTKYEIIERGMRRSLWAEKVDHLSSYEPPSDMESCLDKSDFREAAKTLQGSRDVGAQLYCALLRSIGVRARLVCSLQPLSFGSTGPTLPKPKGNLKPKAAPNKTEQMLSQVAKYRGMANAVSSATSSAGPSTARRRLGHPNASDYNFEPKAAPYRPHQSFEAPKRIRESPYPVYWVEILDVGHQKWQPTDPVVLNSFWKPKIFEPPITDKENSLSYVIAFNVDGTAKDVTRRYAKAYTAKTRKLRIETALDDGRRWWKKVMKMYSPKTPSDLDQIEDVELAGVEAREPMPRNVQDFKNHPVYALERHLRRHEVLIPGAVPSGTVAAGARAPLEKVFRRKDVRVARSAEKWFRLGREVKPMEIPAKWLPKRVTSKRSRFGEDEQREDEDGDAGTPVYTMDQTELYEPAPVRNGRVPKNKFGNIEVYVPSMVPKGGVHIADEYARRAAYVLGIDYAPALTGFSFKGRQGTAVLSGVVIAKEFEEAVRAGIQGMLDLEQEVEDEKRRYVALKLWRRFMMGLSIRERIWSGVGEEERQQADRDAEFEAWAKGAESDETEEFDMVVDDEDDGGGGGFLVGDDDGDEGGGGFLVE